jgi:CheY-like chemotaxis protein
MAKEILIADSDKGDQEEFKKIFEMKDYRLIFSENGEDALEQVKFFKPDLIIADTALSEKSGLQVCSALKADREFKHIPIVLLKGTFEGISERDLEHT